MRGALEPLGIDGENLEITVNEKLFKVKYDKAKADPDKILAALKKAGEPAKLVQ